MRSRAAPPHPRIYRVPAPGMWSPRALKFSSWSPGALHFLARSPGALNPFGTLSSKVIVNSFGFASGYVKLTASRKVSRARSLSFGGFQVLLVWKGVSCSLAVGVLLFSSKKYSASRIRRVKS